MSKLKPSDYVKKGWTQHCCARDREGNACSLAKAGFAKKWCLLGAIVMTYPLSIPGPVIEKICQKLGLSKHSTHALTIWNDAPERTQQEVVELLISVGE